MNGMSFREWLQQKEGDQPIKIGGKPVRRLPPKKPSEPAPKTVDGVHEYKPMSELPPGL